jgi:hypothetical protein
LRHIHSFEGGDEHAIPYKITPIKIIRRFSMPLADKTTGARKAKRTATPSRVFAVLFRRSSFSYSEADLNASRQIEPDFVIAFPSIGTKPPAADHGLTLTDGARCTLYDESMAISNGIFGMEETNLFATDLHVDSIGIMGVLVIQDELSRFEATHTPGCAGSADGLEDVLISFGPHHLQLKF